MSLVKREMTELPLLELDVKSLKLNFVKIIGHPLKKSKQQKSI